MLENDWAVIHKSELKKLDRAFEILRKIEYIEPDNDWYDNKDHIADWLFDGFCPWCQYKKGDGHYSDCPIGEILENE